MPNPTPSPALPVEAIEEAIRVVRGRAGGKSLRNNYDLGLADRMESQLTALQQAVADAQKDTERSVDVFYVVEGAGAFAPSYWDGRSVVHPMFEMDIDNAMQFNRLVDAERARQLLPECVQRAIAARAHAMLSSDPAREEQSDG